MGPYSAGSVADGRVLANAMVQAARVELLNNKPYKQSVIKITACTMIVIMLLGLATIGVNATAVGGHLSASQVGMINLALSGASLLTFGSAFLAAHFSAKKNHISTDTLAVHDYLLQYCFAGLFLLAAYSVVPASLGIAGKLSANTIGWIALAPYMPVVGGGLCCTSSTLLCCRASSNEQAARTELWSKLTQLVSQNPESGGDSGAEGTEEGSGDGGGGPGGGVGAADDGVPDAAGPGSGPDAAVGPDSGDPAKNIEEPR